MSEREQKPIPDWAEQDRGRDLGWIQENLETFWPIAQKGYQEFGRGSVVVDTTTTVTHPRGEGHPFGYFDQETLEQFEDEDLKRLLEAYAPDEEFITTLLKAQDRMSNYRIKVVLRGLGEEAGDWDADDLPLERPAEGVQEDQAEPPAESETLTPPDLETLIRWEEEGGCEAACPHHCWIEADGTCEHGNPSWLIVLGLI